jgi:hypothetical protein
MEIVSGTVHTLAHRRPEIQARASEHYADLRGGRRLHCPRQCSNRYKK